HVQIPASYRPHRPQPEFRPARRTPPVRQLPHARPTTRATRPTVDHLSGVRPTPTRHVALHMSRLGGHSLISSSGMRDELCLECRSLHRYTAVMPDRPGLSYPSATILQTLRLGYTVIDATGLPSGTVYPALRLLEGDRLIRAKWERQSAADAA